MSKTLKATAREIKLLKDARFPHGGVHGVIWCGLHEPEKMRLCEKMEERGLLRRPCKTVRPAWRVAWRKFRVSLSGWILLNRSLGEE